MLVWSFNVVHGSGVGIILHRCLKLNGSKGVVSVMVGSPTMLQDKGSLSESLSLSSQNNLHVFCAMVVSCLMSRNGARVHLANLVLRLSKSSNNED